MFLKWVASFSHVDEETGSKMDLGNLATVITPSILKANRRDGGRDESFPGIRLITELLEEQDELLLAPEEFLHLLQNQNYFTASLDQPRELLKKIDTFFRLRHGSSSSGHLNRPAFPPDRSSAPSPAFYSPSAPSNRSHQDLYNHPPPAPNGAYPADRMPPSAEYNGKSLPPHPGLPHQPFSAPQPTSRLQDPNNPRPSLDNFWAPPAPNNDSRRESPKSRPNSYLKPSNESSPVFGATSPSRNSPLGAS